MKVVKLLVIGMLFLLTGVAKAQVSVNVNIGSPPQWGPVGYNEVRYYYLPDVEAYYDVQTSMFIYYGGGVWIQRTYLPTRYRNYDLYSGYKVVMVDYHGNTPYNNFSQHKVKYKKGYRGGAQKTIGLKPVNGNSNHKMNSQNHQPNKNNGNSGSHDHNKSINNGQGHGGKGKKK